MAIEVPLLDEATHDFLHQLGLMVVDGATGASELVDQSRGDDNVADAERRIENLAEGADVDDGIVRTPRESVRRPPDEVKLGIVIVFDDPTLFRLCPSKKLL